jgi:hypothetical protein
MKKEVEWADQSLTSEGDNASLPASGTAHGWFVVDAASEAASSECQRKAIGEDRKVRLKNANGRVKYGLADGRSASGETLVERDPSGLELDMERSLATSQIPSTSV